MGSRVDGGGALSLYLDLEADGLVLDLKLPLKFACFLFNLYFYIGPAAAPRSEEGIPSIDEGFVRELRCETHELSPIQNNVARNVKNDESRGRTESPCSELLEPLLKAEAESYYGQARIGGGLRGVETGRQEGLELRDRDGGENRQGKRFQGARCEAGQ
jgi:hypothetical protein